MSGRAKEAPVRVGGLLRHVRVDNNALCIVEEQTGVNMLQGVTSPSLSVLRALCYGALVSGAKATGGKTDFTPEDVGNWMEETPELLETVSGLIVPAMPEAAEDPPAVQEEEAPRLSA